MAKRDENLYILKRSWPRSNHKTKYNWLEYAQQHEENSSPEESTSKILKLSDLDISDSSHECELKPNVPEIAEVVETFEEQSDSDDENKDFAHKLASWARNFKINAKALEELLVILRRSEIWPLDFTAEDLLGGGEDECEVNGITNGNSSKIYVEICEELQVDSVRTQDKSEGLRDEVRCLKSDVFKLKQENQALRNTLRLHGALPQLLEDVEKLRSQMQRDRTPKQARQEALLLSPIRRPETSSPKPVKTTASTQAQPTTHDDLTTLSGEVLVTSTKMTKINFSCERKLVNDLLFTVFGREVLQNHSLRGAVCNVHKKSGAGGTRPPLDQEKVNAIEAYVKNFFSKMSQQDFNKYGNDRIKNCRPKRKNKNGNLDKSTPDEQ